jgi:DNA-binding NarL/FixJ family response regulator
LAGSEEAGETVSAYGEDTCNVAFTSRELSILELVAAGCTNVEIGAKLHISKYTVAQHVAKMLRRIGAANRTDLVSRAYGVGILK